MAGALGDPPHGAAIVFGDIDPEQIEAFVRSDPYVAGGLVAESADRASGHGWSNAADATPGGACAGLRSGSYPH